jgi:hypothetical protein
MKTPQVTPEEQIKAASIMHAIEVKTAFELYAYRILSHEQFTDRIKELIQLFESKQPKKKSTVLDNSHLQNQL